VQVGQHLDAEQPQERCNDGHRFAVRAPHLHRNYDPSPGPDRLGQNRRGRSAE
jgi:hypothetical protein